MQSYLTRLENIEKVVKKIANLNKVNAPHYELKIISVFLDEYELCFSGAKRNEAYRVKGTFKRIIEEIETKPSIKVYVNMIWNDEWCHLYMQKDQKERCAKGIADINKKKDLKEKPYLEWLYDSDYLETKKVLELLPQNFFFTGNDLKKYL